MKKETTVSIGKKSSSFGGAGGGEFDDLDKIASEIGISKAEILNNDIVKDIHVEQLKIRHLNFINSIQFFYKITIGDKTYSIEGDNHGGNEGKEIIINFENDEHILNIFGKCGRLVDQLNFSTYISSKKQIKTYGPYGGNGGSSFDLPAFACVFGKSGVDLDAFGIYEGKISSNYENDKKQWETKIQELSGLLFPNQHCDFTQLKQEITRLKAQELAPQVSSENKKLTQLIEEAKNKAREGSFAPIIDLLLETQNQMIEQGSNNAFYQGQLTAYQTVLQAKLTQEELQILLTKQTELYQLEKHLASLQIVEQVAQIQQA